MRKLFIIAIAFAALAFAGCEKERLGADVQNGVLTTITAGREAGPATKSALNEDGENLWSVGDKILVAWAGQKPNVFTSKEKEPSETAKFQGLMSVNNSGDDTKYAIYPAEDGNLVNKDGSYALQFHAEQQGQAGTYDPDAFLAVAQSSENNLSFYNVLGLLRITFAEADCDVKSVTLHPWATPDEESDPEEPEFDDPEDPEDPDNDDEGGFTPPEHVTVTAAGEDDEDEEGDVEAPLIEPAVLVIIPGGVYTVEGGSAPEITGWTEDLDAIVLKAPKGETFSPEAEYYLAVPPCEFTEGVTFELLHSDGTITNVSIDNSVEVERSKIHDVFLESNPYVPVTSVDIADDEITIEVGETYAFDVTVLPKNATNQYFTWSIDDYTIVDISEGGVVIGVAEGTTIVYAISDDCDEEGNPIQDQVTVNVVATEEPGPDANGHEFVDLGLSVLWATMNVGANSETESGDYFNFASTEPYYEGFDGDGSPIWKEGMEMGYTYLYYPYWNTDAEGNIIRINKYIADDYGSIGFESAYDIDPETGYYIFLGDNRDGKYHPNLASYDYEDDAARFNWQGDWRTPSSAEWMELQYYCDWQWTDDYEESGIAGYIISSLVPGYEGASIFIPAVSCWSGTEKNSMSGGAYWTQDVYGWCFSLYFYFDKNNHECSMSTPDKGMPVRPVLTKKDLLEEIEENYVSMDGGQNVTELKSATYFFDSSLDLYKFAFFADDLETPSFALDIPASRLKDIPLYQYSAGYDINTYQGIVITIPELGSYGVGFEFLAGDLSISFNEETGQVDLAINFIDELQAHVLVKYSGIATENPDYIW